jgi:hypothetical protein
MNRYVLILTGVLRDDIDVFDGSRIRVGKRELPCFGSKQMMRYPSASLDTIMQLIRFIPSPSQSGNL